MRALRFFESIDYLIGESSFVAIGITYTVYAILIGSYVDRQRICWRAHCALAFVFIVRQNRPTLFRSVKHTVLCICLNYNRVIVWVRTATGDGGTETEVKARGSKLIPRRKINSVSINFVGTKGRVCSPFCEIEGDNFFDAETLEFVRRTSGSFAIPGLSTVPRKLSCNCIPEQHGRCLGDTEHLPAHILKECAQPCLPGRLATARSSGEHHFVQSLLLHVECNVLFQALFPRNSTRAVRIDVDGRVMMRKDDGFSLLRHVNDVYGRKPILHVHLTAHFYIPRN